MKDFVILAVAAPLTPQQIQQSAATFNAQSHPRGADGKFITTGGTVQVLGANGKAVAEGQVISVTTGSTGTHIQIRNPTTGQAMTVTPQQVQQAPVAEATLSAAGTQGLPTNAVAAARAGRQDALKNLKQRSGKDALGQQAAPNLVKAYQEAYAAERAKMVKIAANKAKAAAKKSAAAAKKKAAATSKAGSGAYKVVSLKSTAPKHYVGE